MLFFSASASFVISTNVKPRSNAVSQSNGDMNLHPESVTFEQPPKLLVPHLRTRSPIKRFFDVPRAGRKMNDPAHYRVGKSGNNAVFTVAGSSLSFI